MTDSKNIRIDKYLWAVRIFKTRSLASEACRKGRIIINDIQVKPSRIVARGEIITVKKLPVIYKFEVIDPIENRISAKLVPLYISDITSAEEKLKLLAGNTPRFGFRPKGLGRPTKKERRTIDRFSENQTAGE
jgi:ribosome-associated heat shock protein Hsp15